MTLSTQAFPKRCGCCGTTYSHGAWSRLPLVGYMHDDGTAVLELRQCPCQSSLALPIVNEAKAAC